MFDFRFFDISKSAMAARSQPCEARIVDTYSQKRPILGAMRCVRGASKSNGGLRLVPAARKCCCLEAMLLCRRTSDQNGPHDSAALYELALPGLVIAYSR